MILHQGLKSKMLLEGALASAQSARSSAALPFVSHMSSTHEHDSKQAHQHSGGTSPLCRLHDGQYKQKI